MPGEALLLTIALMASRSPDSPPSPRRLRLPAAAWHPAMRIRQRAIVSTSFNVMFESLAPSIAFLWLGDERAALTAASAGGAIYATGIVIWRGRQFLRAGVQRTGSTVVLFARGPTATVLFWANALVVGSVAIYAVALCIQLTVAVVSFYSLVSAAQS